MPSGLSYVETTETDLPLELVVNNFSTGPVSGLTPTVAVRDASTSDSYLDWSDNTFKTSGWTLKDAPMTEITAGIYQRSLDINALSKSSGFRIAVEYTTTGAGTSGVAVETYLLTDEYAQVTKTRKYATNRLEAQGGNPGSLTLYDDDGTTVLETQTLRDYTGGAVADTAGSPAKRGPAVP